MSDHKVTSNDITFRIMENRVSIQFLKLNSDFCQIKRKRKNKLNQLNIH